MAVLSRKVLELERELLCKGGGETERIDLRVRGEISLLVVAPLVSIPPPKPPVLHSECNTTQRKGIVVRRDRKAIISLAAPRLWITLSATLQG